MWITRDLLWLWNCWSLKPPSQTWEVGFVAFCWCSPSREHQGLCLQITGCSWRGESISSAKQYLQGCQAGPCFTHSLWIFSVNTPRVQRKLSWPWADSYRWGERGAAWPNFPFLLLIASSLGPVACDPISRLWSVCDAYFCHLRGVKILMKGLKSFLVTGN